MLLGGLQCLLRHAAILVTQCPVSAHTTSEFAVVFNEHLTTT